MEALWTDMYELNIELRNDRTHELIVTITATDISIQVRQTDLRFGSSIQANLTYVIDDHVVEHIFHGKTSTQMASSHR